VSFLVDNNCLPRFSSLRFLLARFYMDSIATKLTRNSLRTALATLPTDIYATYDETIERIKIQSPEAKDLALRVLMWTAWAYKPLSIPELRHAIAIECGATALDDDDLVEDTHLLTSVCAGLARVDHETGTVHLVRGSVSASVNPTKPSCQTIPYKSISWRNNLCFSGARTLSSRRPVWHTYLSKPTQC
jgi:hypothetical protein